MQQGYLGNLYIVAAPSGGGKTSLVKQLVQEVDEIGISISHTTRPKRPGEVDGVDYFFIKEPEFQSMIEHNAFVEHAHVFNYCYGTSFGQINDRLASGVDVVLDIDWQGAQQIKRTYPDACNIFIVPPSLKALKQRLENRRQDSNQVIEERMERARNELSHYVEFDYLVVNDDFDTALEQLKAIVMVNRLRTPRQSIQQGKLLSFLLSSTI